MAGYLALLFPFKLHTCGNNLEGRSFVPKTFYVSAPRNHYGKTCKVNQFSAENACKLIAPHLRILNVIPQQKTVNADPPMTSDWVPIMDQVFLLVSITLTYMAGVIPAEKFPYNTQTRISEDNEAKWLLQSYLVFTHQGVAVLEDLAITLADGIASLYLELISVYSNLSNEMNSLGLSLCRLSTRELQRLRNEVVLRQWLHQNMEAVVSMYEDHFDLRTLQVQSIEESNRSKGENVNWWKRLCLRRTGSVSSSVRFAVISHISLPVKRTMELWDLTCWSYYFSLYLELADITMPFIRMLLLKSEICFPSLLNRTVPGTYLLWNTAILTMEIKV